MTVDRVSNPAGARRGTASDVLLDGLFTGMIGALAVALWFLLLDVVNGRPLYTPALLGTVLLHGSHAAAADVVIAPVEIAAYTAFHFVAFIVVGTVLSYLFTLFERFPIMFFVILVLFLSLQVGFFFLNLALGTQLLGKLSAWSVVVGNVLAAAGMALFQWKRHPSVVRGIERLWADEGPQSS
jgi:hypothetical protein